jgi:hypothetical protein
LTFRALLYLKIEKIERFEKVLQRFFFKLKSFQSLWNLSESKATTVHIYLSFYSDLKKNSALLLIFSIFISHFSLLTSHINIHTQEYAHFLKTAEDSVRIRASVINRFEQVCVYSHLCEGRKGNEGNEGEWGE